MLCRTNAVMLLQSTEDLLEQNIFVQKKGCSRRVGGLMATNIVVLSQSHTDLGDEGVKILFFLKSTPSKFLSLEIFGES